MPLKHFLYPAIVLVVAALTLSNCKPGENCADLKRNYYYLFDEEKHLDPYTGYDTLKFKHSNGNTYTFYGQGLDSGFSVQSSHTSPDCEENILNYRQYYRTVFLSENYGKIEFRKYLPLLATSNDGGDLGISRTGVNLYSIIGNYYRANTNNKTFFDSLVINNKTYYRVVTMPYEGNYESPNKAYFNQDYGILKVIISNKNNDVLERVPD